MRRLGFATSRVDPDLTADDRLACAPLARAGWRVEPVVWDAAADLDRLDALVLRSCWDYHHQPEAFAAWLDRLGGLGLPVINAPAVCAWNLDKRYLLELRAAGAPVPDTAFVPAGSGALEDAAEALTGERVVVKPTISLNGEDTWLLSRRDVARSAEIRALARRRDLLVQEYVPEITAAGELSFVFLGGEFSHAIRKLPKPGEFRVQVEHGGRRLPCTPTDDQIAQAAAILDRAAGAPLIARVDMVERGDRLLLIELELIDPMLFLGYAPGAPERFAGALLERLARGG